jgi:hypothetical protein
MSGRPKDPVWEHGDNLAPEWRCNYCGMQKSGGGQFFDILQWGHVVSQVY